MLHVNPVRRNYHHFPKTTHSVHSVVHVATSTPPPPQKRQSASYSEYDDEGDNDDDYSRYSQPDEPEDFHIDDDDDDAARNFRSARRQHHLYEWPPTPPSPHRSSITDMRPDEGLDRFRRYSFNFFDERPLPKTSSLFGEHRNDVDDSDEPAAFEHYNSVEPYCECD